MTKDMKEGDIFKLVSFPMIRVDQLWNETDPDVEKFIRL
jgi:hypothetical protein